MTTTTHLFDVSRRLDHGPVGPVHVLALGLCAAGFAFDLLEMALGSALSAVFSSGAAALAPAALSWLLASVYVGAIAGAPLFGWMGDRFGRRQVMVWLLWLLALSSLLAAASRSTQELTVWRGVSGLALGAFPALMISYLTDLLPAKRRGPLIFLVVGLASLGAPAGIFLVRGLTPIAPLGIEAWRWGFIVGAAGALAVALLMLLIPESPRWLMARGRDEEARQAALRFVPALVEVPEEPGTAMPLPLEPRRRTWPLVAALFFASPWSTVAFPLLAGALLMGRGFKLQDALLYVAVSNFGPVIGVLLAALGVDRIERRITLALCAIAMLAAGAGFVLANDPLILTACATGFMLAAALYVPSLSVYGAELFPTRSRAAAFGGAWTFNRIGAAAAPLLLVPLMSKQGSDPLMLVIAASLMGSLALIAVAPAGRARRTVH